MAHHYIEYFPVDFESLCSPDQLSDAIMVGRNPDDPTWIETYKEYGYEEDPMDIYNKFIQMCKDAYKQGCTSYADDFGTEDAGLYGWDYEDELTVFYDGDIEVLSREELEK